MIEIIVLDKDLYSFADLGPKTLGSAGLDLKLARDAKPAAQLAAEGADWPYYDLIGTGLKVRVPTNMVGLIVPRSSAGHKHGFHIGNTIGVIDSDYRGELMMSIGGGDYGKLKRGAAVAQLILVPYSSFYGAKVVDEFSDADTAYGEGCRGEGGYGSTDTKSPCKTLGPGCEGCPDCSAVMGDATYAEMFGSTDKCPVQNLLAVSEEWAHSTEQLAEQKLNVLQDLDHETAQLQYEQYALATKNGGF